MPEDIDTLIRRLVGGAPDADQHVRDRAATSADPTLLVAAALVTSPPDALLARAAAAAVSTRERQLVAVAAALLNGNTALLDVLVREHLVDFPDNILAAWIAAEHLRTVQPTPSHPGSFHA